MSLEDAIVKLTAAVEKNNELVEKVLAQAGGITEETVEDKPKRGRKPKEETSKEEAAPVKEEKKAPAKSDDDDEDEAPAIDFKTVREKCAAWLGEFAKESDKTEPEKMHPEAAARKEKIKGIIKKLGGEKLADLAENADAVKRLDAWLEKTRAADNGYGKGRLVPDAAPEEDDDEV